MKPRVIVLRAAGTNCDMESAFAFESVGAKADIVHINRLKEKNKQLDDYHILVIPGGFTYGDDIASGKILANELKYTLFKELKDFLSKGKLILGICNGFQVLVKAGFLPNFKGDAKNIDATLNLNDSARFEDRWVYLRTTDGERRMVRQAVRQAHHPSNRPEQSRGAHHPSNHPERSRGMTRCVWTKYVKDIIYLPVAHGEGKFIPQNKNVLQKLRKNGQIVFRYVNKKGKTNGYPYNPNGSINNIAGICDPTGRILGMMPHPERFIQRTQHPRWTRENIGKEGDGLAVFRSGLEYVKKELSLKRP